MTMPRYLKNRIRPISWKRFRRWGITSGSRRGRRAPKPILTVAAVTRTRAASTRWSTVALRKKGRYADDWGIGWSDE